MQTIKKYLRLTTLLVASILLASQPGVALAVDSGTNHFHLGNDILFYDPNDRAGCTVNGSTSSIVGSDNAEKVFNYLTTTDFEKLGGPMTPMQAAAVLGNFQRESGMDPASVQGGRGPGRGLAQWGSFTARYDRFGHPHANDVSNPPERLMDFVRSRDLNWTDLEAQLEFVKHELSGWEGDNLVNKGFLEATTLDEATEIFDTAYERSGTKAMSDRQRYAREFYARFEGIEAALGKCANTGPTGDYMSTDFVTYSQCSHTPYGGSWGNIRTTRNRHQTACSVACGPTSLAMVIRNMTRQSLTGNNVTPEDTITYYNTHNLWDRAGSGPVAMRQAAENWGLRHEAFDSSELSNYREVFDNGGLIVVAGRGGLPFYTNINHYVVVRGITPDGKFRVSDPGRGVIDDYEVESFIADTTRTGAHTAFYPN